MLDSISGVGDETGRLELKRELTDRPKIAHLVCALANADGGIIAIGVDQPTKTAPLKVYGQIDTSDSARASLIAGINARIYPPPPLEIYAYHNAASSFIVLRVGPVWWPLMSTSQATITICPVKRANLTGRLTLGEIDALRSRSQNVYSKSPLGDRQDRVTWRSRTRAGLYGRCVVRPADIFARTSHSRCGRWTAFANRSRLKQWA